MEQVGVVDEQGEEEELKYEALVETMIMESAHTEMQVRVLENAFMALEDFKHEKISEAQLRYTVYAMESVAYADMVPQHRLVVANENILTRMFKRDPEPAGVHPPGYDEAAGLDAVLPASVLVAEAADR